CARDAASGAKFRNQTDGELLECLGAAHAGAVSTGTRGRSRTRAKNRCGVRARRAERDRRFSAVRKLALRSGEERRWCDYRLWILRRGMGALAEGAADTGLCDDEKTQDGPEQPGGRRRDDRA